MNSVVDGMFAELHAMRSQRPPDLPNDEAPATANREGLQEINKRDDETTATAPVVKVLRDPEVLTVSIVESVDAGSKINAQPFTWDEFSAWLREPKEQPRKDRCALLKLATFGDRRSAKGSLRYDANVVEVFGIEGDYDGEQVSPAEAAERLTAAGVRALIYTSPSHRPEAPRWRVLAPLSQSCAPAERARFVDLLNGALGGILATESWTLSQVFYLGRVVGSPYEFHSIGGACVDDLDMVLEPIGKPRTAPPAPAVVQPARAWAAGELEAAVAAVRDSAAQDAKFQKLFAGDTEGYGSQSEADLAFLNLAAMHGARDQDVLDGLMRESALMRDKWEREDYRERTLGLALNARSVEPAADEDFEVIETPKAIVAVPDDRPPLKFKQVKGQILPVIENIATALRSPDWCGFDLAFDTFRDEVMIAPRGTAEWRALSDEGTTQIMEAFGRARFRPIARETMRNTLSMVAKEHTFDSAILWLNGLTWDGKLRVERFLTDYCHAEDSAYTRAVSLYLWTALAGRILEPGCKADSVPILVGPQGAKKTTAAREFVVDEDHFTTINLAERDETLSRRIRGRLVGEISELRGLGTRDLEAVKAFISATHEEWIPKFREFRTSFARRLVFVGTTNSQEFLSDETGNRRWLPVRVEHIDIEAIRRDRLQLWAEGAAQWTAAGVAWQGVEQLAPAEHSQYMISDSWDTLLDRWLDLGHIDDLGGTGPPRRGTPFTMAEVMQEALNLSTTQMTRANEMRVAKLLKLKGMVVTVVREGSRTKRVWVQA